MRKGQLDASETRVPARFVIADISGYTVVLAGVELEHAQDIIADVMDTMVKRLRPRWREALMNAAPCRKVCGVMDASAYSPNIDAVEFGRYPGSFIELGLAGPHPPIPISPIIRRSASARAAARQAAASRRVIKGKGAAMNNRSANVASTIPFDTKKLDDLLEQAGIDVLIATSKHNVGYLLGGYRFFFFRTTDAIGINRYLPVLIYAKGHALLIGVHWQQARGL